MPRVKSATGIYHIMVRGIDKRNIFIDDQDRAKFLEKVFKAKKTAGFELYGYCLMDNHVHLLMKEKEDIGTSMKRITVGYVQWHNIKHERTGHLFQNRYRSEPVQSESYLLNVLRYIHQNPVKANIINSPGAYEWSSYNQYIRSFNSQETFIDDEMIKAYFSDERDFEDFMNISVSDEFLEDHQVQKVTDEKIRNYIELQIPIERFSEFTPDERNNPKKSFSIR